MGSRIRRGALSFLIASALIASAPLSMAATTKPAPKLTAKATPKKVITKKPVAKKPVAKKPVAKKPVAKKKRVYKKRVKVSPSPAPVWPPKGFHENSKVYAKVPTSKELIGVLSAAKPLAAQVKKCSTFACGAVQVASATGCTWWEITATVSGPTSESDRTLKILGALRTTAVGTKPKKIVTVLLISTEPLKPKVTVGGINVNCYRSPITGRVPSNSYVLNTPTPSPSPTASPSASTSPTPEPTS
ncbi:MAG: hypothetical protein HY050_10945 [Actinobacteria bacterium]|nr:hypothetical protein [Actinomycetota bacterium]